MSIDGIFLNKLTIELQVLVSGRITKIHQLSETDVLLVIRANKENYNLIFSISNEYSRIHLSTREYTAPQQPIGLTMFMRKHIEGYLIGSLKTHQADRVLTIELIGTNEIGDMERKQIILEIMGRHSNLIITRNGYILEALRHQGVFEAKRTMLPNAIYQYPDLTDKYNPLILTKSEIETIFNEKFINSPKEIVRHFQGISPFLANQIYDSKYPAEKMHELINLKINPIIFEFNNKLDYYYFNNNFQNAKHYPSLNALLDDFYYDLANQERIKQKTNDLLLFVTRTINRLTIKLDKLHEEIIEANNGDIYRLCGELLLANLQDYKSNASSINLINYYTNEEITIPLDARYSLVKNSQSYFKKYQKSKKAILHLNEQVIKTQDEIEYFNLIYLQIRRANLNDIIEIQTELENEKYLTLKQRKGKIPKPKLTTYLTEHGTNIMVGKNNLQNELLTHKLSLPNEMWFHVKDGPGSHVVIKKTSDLTENDIRTAANLAAYYSLQKDSSSVAVNYTLIRYIKKIPGKRNCFVTISNEKTIFIDPDDNLIKNLQVKK